MAWFAVSRRTMLAGLGGSIAAGGAALRVSPALAATVPADPILEARIEELLGRMTVEEKFGQLQQLTWNGDTGPGGGQTEHIEEAARNGLLGSVLNIYGATHTNALQRIAVQESRLGIPLILGLDIIHGYWTTFPIPLAQACSFEPSIAVTDAEISAKEGRSVGVHWTFAPMMDVTHEPRWGRIAEGCGEDPYLTARFAAEKTRAYQGEDYSAPDRMAACAKHFVAYGGAEGGRDYNTVDASEARLRNLYLPPFKAAVESGVATVMAAFNTISGVPAHGNGHMLTEVLKDQWGFDGFVVSDYTGVQEMIPHGFAADGADAARLTLNAGVEMEMVSTNLVDHGRQLYDSGKITRNRLDDAVRRILRIKFRLNLFERPYVDEQAEITGPTEHTRAEARRVAGRCMVLLKNDSGALPLEKSVGSIAVVGPFADSADLLGTWTRPEAAAKYPPVTILQGIRNALPAATVTHARGVDPEGKHTENIPDAVAAAKAADVTVLVVGEPSAWSGEANSRSDISLPGAQELLVSAIAATGKPCVVVLVNGRPLTVGGWVDSVPACLEAWHPGIEAGNAIADVLFGVVNPGGKLAVSFPRSVGQVPIYYNHENTGRPYDPDNEYTSYYLDLEVGPRFAFGHGLSYTTFEVGAPQLSTDTIPAASLRHGAVVEVTVPVVNTGDREGDEVVQLYLHDRVATVVQPIRKLRGFQRVGMRPGQRRVVRFELGAQDLGFWTHSAHGEFVVEPGQVDVYAGNSSLAENKRTLTIT